MSRHFPLLMVIALIGCVGLFAAGATYGEKLGLMGIPAAKADMLPPLRNETVLYKGKEIYSRIPAIECDLPYVDVVDEFGELVGCDRRPG